MIVHMSHYNRFDFISQRSPVKKVKKEGEGNTFELSKNRRVTVRSFKGKTYVDIREFFQKGDEWAPGKKGISLSPEQWEKLLEHVDDIKEAVKNT